MIQLIQQITLSRRCHRPDLHGAGDCNEELLKEQWAVSRSQQFWSQLQPTTLERIIMEPRACTHIVITVLNNNYLHMQSIPINWYYLTGNIYHIIQLHTEEQEHKWLNTVSRKGHQLFFHKPRRWKEKVMNTSVSIISVAG